MLLDNPPHSVSVALAVTTLDKYNGDAITYPSSITVRCAVQPLSADEAAGLGVSPSTSYRVIARSWPGGMLSRVIWDGRTFFQRGETLHRSMSPRTKHDYAVLVSNVAEVK